MRIWHKFQWYIIYHVSVRLASRVLGFVAVPWRRGNPPQGVSQYWQMDDKCKSTCNLWRCDCFLEVCGALALPMNMSFAGFWKAHTRAAHHLLREPLNTQFFAVIKGQTIFADDAWFDKIQYHGSVTAGGMFIARNFRNMVDGNKYSISKISFTTAI